jgi:hypothetical protein
MSLQKLVSVLNSDLSYNEEGKKAFHKEAKSALRKVAKALHLNSNDFDLRSNKGGVAVSGEVTLHTDTLYLQISQSMGKATVLFRSCNGRKDYSGGQNRYANVESLLDESTLSTFLKIQEG